MDLGFETIGNASILVHDDGPVLATDPWLDGTAYFGSWKLTHEVPEAQRQSFAEAKFLWLSHGHPDHLSPESLEGLRGKPLLIGDHYGGRIARGLREDGYDVHVLETGRWTQLSPRVRVMCVPDYTQDSMLLIDVGGTLLVNANDAADRGVGDRLREIVATFEKSYLLCLTGYGDADMINFFDESGQRVLPHAAKKEPIGPQIAMIIGHYGIRGFAPSSSMHKYGRTDSAWANEYKTPSDVHSSGFDSAAGELLPSFVRYDVARGEHTPIAPPETSDELLEPEAFGDSWSDELEPADVAKLETYFRRVDHLHSFLGFVRFRVGGKEHTIDIARDRFERGITFETPRASLMTCVEYDVFDDLMIGNFTKTTVHGDWCSNSTEALYPDFIPFVTKYSDNGGARTPAELAEYFAFYAKTGLFGPGPAQATQASWASLERYL